METGLEQEQLHLEAELNQRVSEEEVECCEGCRRKVKSKNWALTLNHFTMWSTFNKTTYIPRTGVKFEILYINL